MPNFQLLFSGDLVAGAARESVQQNLAHELGIDRRKSAALFSGRTVVLKSQLDESTALQWQQRLNDLGALCRIKDLDAKPANDSVNFKADLRANDHTLRDITAAHLECPRCGHLQLDSSHCARCGVDLHAAFKQKRKEDLIIEKKIRELRGQPGSSGVTGSQPVVSPAQVAANDGSRSRIGKMVSWIKRSGG